MKKTAYRYKLIKWARDINGTITWLRVWYKEKVTKYKYKYYPIVLTYSNNAGYYVEKKFKDWTALKEYMATA